MAQSTAAQSVAAELCGLADTLETVAPNLDALTPAQLMRFRALIVREMPDALRRVAARVAILEGDDDEAVVDLRPLLASREPSLTVIKGGRP